MDIRHYRDRFEINSPGGFAGGVKPENILHHPPVTRNRYLVETVLLATRLVNRQNLGVPRIFRALLEEGKEPPTFDEIGQTVRVTFPGQKVDKAFKALLKLASLETNQHMLEHSGTGRGTTYRLSRRAAAILSEGVAYDMTRRLDKEAVKVRILSLLKDRPLSYK